MLGTFVAYPRGDNFTRLGTLLALALAERRNYVEKLGASAVGSQGNNPWKCQNTITGYTIVYKNAINKHVM